MLFIDEFFLMIGHNKKFVDHLDFLYLVKGSEIKQKYRIHHSISFVRKFVGAGRFLVSVGFDEVGEEK
jgi:hypothetical protein